MRRVLRWLAGSLGVLVGLFVVLLIFLNLDPGRRMAESLVFSLSGGTVRIEGLSGLFPVAPRIARIIVADGTGPYLRIEDLALEWQPGRLFGGVAQIDVLTARAVTLDRLPVSEAPSPAPSDSGTPSLPLQILLSRVLVERVTVGEAVIGHRVSLTVDGSAAVLSASEGALRLTLTAGADRYEADLQATQARISGQVTVREAQGGLLSVLAGMPDLGAILARVALDGPPDRVGLDLTLDAGPLHATAQGTVPVTQGEADLSLAVTAPAMAPNPALRWRAISLAARLRGPLTAPAATGTLSVDAFHASGVTIDAIRADVSGDTRDIALAATIAGVRIPGPHPELLAATPIAVDAAVRLADPALPLTLSVRHPLLRAEASGSAVPPTATLRLTLPDLAPLAALAGMDLGGDSELRVTLRDTNDVIDVTVRGPVRITSGNGPVPALIGTTGAIDLALTRRGEAITVSRAHVTGQGIDLKATGQVAPNRLDIGWTGSLKDIGALQPTLSGSVDAKGSIEGPPDAFALRAELAGTITNGGHGASPLTVQLEATSLPATPSIRVRAAGSLLDSPMAAVIDGALRDGVAHVAIERIAWKSVAIAGDLTLPAGATLPVGRMVVRVNRLEDLAPLIGRPASGVFQAEVTADAAIATARATADGVNLSGIAALESGILEAAVTSPTTSPSVDASVTLRGIRAGGVTVNTRLTAKGPREAVALVLQADGLGRPGSAAARGVSTSGGGAILAGTTSAAGASASRGTTPFSTTPGGTPDRGSAGGRAIRGGQAAAKSPKGSDAIQAGTTSLPAGPATLSVSATLRDQAASLDLTALRAAWGGQIVTLQAPARIGFAGDTTVDQLRLRMGGAELTAAGRAGATLDLSVTLRDLPLSLLALVDPSLRAEGSIAGSLRLTGSAADPTGTFTLRGTGLRLRQGFADALPAGTLPVDATLRGGKIRTDARAVLGTSNLAVAGLVPLKTTDPMDLSVRGTVDLALTDPILAASGRRARGTVILDMAVSGPVSAPRPAGVIRLTDGDVQDSVFGARLRAISATIQAAEAQLRLARFQAQAGEGTIEATGALGLAGDMPVSLALRADNARLLASDVVTATVDATLDLGGTVAGPVTLGGTVRTRRIDIRIPERLPSSVATIPVRVAGASPPPPARPAPPIALNLILEAPGQVFIRGRGVDAELEGRVTVDGSMADPHIGGGLRLRRGLLSILGQDIAMTEGRIDFAGAAVTNPALRLVAAARRGSTTAKINIDGSVKDPKITFSSVPELPRDEVLSQLLFSTATSRLSPFQLAQLANAIASLSGGPSLGDDPLGRLRGGLGLDRLSVGSDGAGRPVLEAGRYIADGVYVGTRQGASGGDTQATIQVDLGRGVKLEATTGSGQTSATGASSSGNSSSVGVTYQLEY